MVNTEKGRGSLDVVTGASGHLGNVLIRELAARGSRVRAMFRSEPHMKLPDNVEVVYGDLADTASLERTFHGADRVFHTAAMITIGPDAYSKLYKANVEGTKNVIETFRKVSSGRLVYIGSIEAFDLLSGNNPITESSCIDPARTVMPYGRSKATAVLEVEKAVAEYGLDAVTVFPTGYIGPFDDKLSPMTNLVADFARGKVPAGLAGGFDFVDVRDVAAGTIAAAEKGSPGDRYLLPGTYTSVVELFAILSEITGRKAPGITIPFWLTGFIGFLAEVYYGIRGGQPRYTRMSLKILTLGVRVSGELAYEKLGFSPRPLKDSLLDTVRWIESRSRPVKEGRE